MPGNLAPYQAKRDFAKTREPKGTRRAEAKAAAAPSPSLSFVVQKHAARRLHYDFRLELDGVLKSWAVTRGPSLVPGEKRLAVEVEDHPLDYASFEGTIPKGQYGGGTVIVWDRGTWTPVGDPERGLRKGHLEFSLQGEKLKGAWHLVRMAPRRGETRVNWLLIKADDEYARVDGAPDILEEAPASVLSEQTIEEVTADADADVWDSRTGRHTTAPSAEAEAASSPRPARKAPPAAKPAATASLPAFVEPALARLAEAPPDRGEWLHEVKFDGYRIQPRIAGGAVRLFTRKGLDWTERFAPIATALEALPVRNAILDGEIVVEGADGVSSFSALQEALSEGREERFVCYLFDLLFLDGKDWRTKPLQGRKAKLADLLSSLAPGGPIRLSDAFTENGLRFLEHACRLGLEGIVSKRANGPYRSGRTGDWVKTKCARRQEFVIGGFTRSTARRGAIAALIVGAYEGDKLVYTGRVGTGYTQAVARDLLKRLDGLTRKTSPFAALPPDERRKDAVWTTPKLVAEVAYGSFTADRILRHASFQGLREDKDPREVRFERPDTDDEGAISGGETAGASGKTQARTSRKGQAMTASDVRFTHPDRVYWPDIGLTKQGLADYYTRVWPWIEPHIVGRPLALVRCPGGTAEACFFQKHAWAGLDDHVERTRDPEGDEELLSILDLDGLMEFVQAGVLEIHPWGAMLADIEHPERLIFDLDPGPGVAWDDVIAAAHAVRGRLDARGLKSFVKTSGGKGLHVVVPLKPRAAWDEAKDFCRSIAEEMEAADPDRFVANMAKKARNGRIFVDYLRNGRGSTAVAAYSTRARDGAPVSTPLTWDELSPKIGPAHFTVLNLADRLDHLSGDPWADFETSRRPLPEAAQPKRARRR